MDYKQCILLRLQTKRSVEQEPFQEIVQYTQHLQEALESLKNENFGLRMESASHDHKRLLSLQEQLTELHKNRGQHSELLLQLKNETEVKDKEIKGLKSLVDNKDIKLREILQTNKSHEDHILRLEQARQSVLDEHAALQMAFGSLEAKHLEREKEFALLLDKYLAFKSDQCDRMNQEMAPPAPISVPPLLFSIPPEVAKPSGKHLEWEAHESEVNAVKVLSDSLVLTGGGDRKVKLWHVDSTVQSKAIFLGSNAAITSLDFENDMVLAASNDFASRVWSADGRLRRTLTGHANKVLAAKFMSGGNKVVSGSHDRTLKLWDLNRNACYRTLFAGSSCNDVVCVGQVIVSGHFDKRVRFWESRTESTCNEILLDGRVTSLSVFDQSLLACVRDDSIKLLDLRMNSVVKTFCAEGFKVGCDWSRACFSPDGQYVACGSADGAVFVWSQSGKLESVLKQHKNNVIACSWGPMGLVSVDKQKTSVFWK